MPATTRPSRSPDSLRVTLLIALVAGGAASAAMFGLLRLGTASDAVDPTASPVTSSSPNAVPAVSGAGSSAGDAVGASAVESLRAALDEADAERAQLAGTLLALDRRSAALEERVAALQARVEAEVSGAIDASLPSGEEGEVIVSGESVADSGSPRPGRNDGPEADLLAAGLDPQSAADIRRRRDEFQLARLELSDRAAREGWLDSERFSAELEALETARPDLREELGDELYDRYLFERGGSNRVGIAAVISGSAADQAGLRPGDVLLSYADRRVFRSSELQAATREGSRGENVQIGVLREGEIIAVDVPRGPLGVTLDGTRLPPG